MKNKPDGIVYFELLKLKRKRHTESMAPLDTAPDQPDQADQADTPSTTPHNHPDQPGGAADPYTLGVKGSASCRKGGGEPITTARQCIEALLWLGITPHTRIMLDGVPCYQDKFGMGQATTHCEYKCEYKWRNIRIRDVVLLFLLIGSQQLWCREFQPKHVSNPA